MNVRLARALLAACLASSLQALAQPRPFDPFAASVARVVSDVIALPPAAFSLLVDDAGSFAFYGATSNAFEPVNCERAAGFGLAYQANQMGRIRVGLCTKQVARVRELATRAEPAVKATLAELFAATGSQPDAAALAKAGWRYTRSTGPDGEDQRTFPLIMIGHGVMSLTTVVVIPKDGAVAALVQADTHQLCERMQDPTPLCREPAQALADIARRTLARASAR